MMLSGTFSIRNRIDFASTPGRPTASSAPRTFSIRNRIDFASTRPTCPRLCKTGGFQYPQSDRLRFNHKAAHRQTVQVIFQYPQSDRLRFNFLKHIADSILFTFQYPQSDRLRFNDLATDIVECPECFQYPQSDRLRFNQHIRRVEAAARRLSVSAIGSTSLQPVQ